MILRNVIVIGSNVPVNIRIEEGKIREVLCENIIANLGEMQLSFDNALAFPGLVNSHDHLDFNLFPQLGDSTYNNYTEWGKHIHEKYKQEIDKVLQVPLALREKWGIIKNLICGVTTVVNHGAKVKNQQPLITVHEQCYCLHSTKFEKLWWLKINNPFEIKYPVVIHTGEGTDRAAHKEIDNLTDWNLFNKTLVGVHAVAMSKRQAKKFKAIVWCPQSNYFLLAATAPVNELKNYTSILFGTDSTLTSNWNIWEHLRMARNTNLLTDIEIYHALTMNAADAWKTSGSKIERGKKADIVVTKMKSPKTMDAFFATDPEDILLVLHGGKVRLFDETLESQFSDTDTSRFSKIYINGTCKYVRGKVPALIKDILQYYPEAKFPVTIDPE